MWSSVRPSRSVKLRTASSRSSTMMPRWLTRLIFTALELRDDAGRSPVLADELQGEGHDVEAIPRELGEAHQVLDEKYPGSEQDRVVGPRLGVVDGEVEAERGG